MQMPKHLLLYYFLTSFSNTKEGNAWEKLNLKPIVINYKDISLLSPLDQVNKF